MGYEWIKAHAALQFVSAASTRQQAIEAICRRAHAGSLTAKAASFHRGDAQYQEALIPKEFWWADGQAALEQDWTTGDFETWIDRSLHLQAFDVSFDFVALSDLVPAHKRPEAMQAFSITGNPEWISAYDLYTLAFTRFNPVQAGRSIIEACQTGHMVARAARMEFTLSGVPDPNDSASIEWDVPLWFWRDFTGQETSNQNWQTGRMSGRGKAYNSRASISLQGVHFHRAGLAALGLSEQSPPTPDTSRKGLRSEYGWPNAISVIWGKLYRGELIANVQADVEKALAAHLKVDDKEPGESTVRPYAKIIWDEFQKP